MMPVALKAQWSVQAGLIPGSPMHEYGRAWSYTSVDYERDGNQRGAAFAIMREEAHHYARTLEDGGLNWVTTEYLWM